jgi:TRAP transporter TAXI family solute receptor
MKAQAPRPSTLAAAVAWAAWMWAAAVLFPTSAPAQVAAPTWPASLTLVTASPGGTYHAYGMGLARILTRVLDVPVAERTTEGPSENIRLIEAGEAQIGFVTMGAALQGWNGTGEWTNGKQYRAVRAAFPMYDTPFHFIARSNSAIRSLADMAGKRIGVGPETGTAGTYMPKSLAALGIEGSFVYGTWEDIAAQLQDGGIEVIAAAVGAPFPAIAELEKQKQVRFLPVSREEIVAMRLAVPELTPSLIPAGTYPSLRKGYNTVGLYNFAVVHKDLPNDLVYQIVDAVFAHQDELVAAHPAAAATVPGNFVQNHFLPYHPGASRYYAARMIPGIVRGD